MNEEWIGKIRAQVKAKSGNKEQRYDPVYGGWSSHFTDKEAEDHGYRITIRRSKLKKSQSKQTLPKPHHFLHIQGMSDVFLILGIYLILMGTCMYTDRNTCTHTHKLKS